MEWLKIPYRAAWRLVMVDEGLELSGYIAFAAFLCLFPFLNFLAPLAGFLGDRETANEFVQAVREVVGVRERGLLTFSILATLWFASSGVEALRSGLNRAHSVTEERAMWWLRLQSIAFVIASAFVIFVLSLVVILGTLVWRVFGAEIEQDVDSRLVYLILRYLVAVALLLGALLLLHRWLPNTRQAFVRVLPGVCVTTLLW
jgi:membrane protein